MFPGFIGRAGVRGSSTSPGSWCALITQGGHCRPRQRRASRPKLFLILTPGYCASERILNKPFRIVLQTRLPNPPAIAIFHPSKTQPFVAFENTRRHYRSQRLALCPAIAR